MVGATCEEYPLVPRFEGEEGDQCETMDLPVTECSPTPVESPSTEVFDPLDFAPEKMHDEVEELLPSVTNLPAGCAKYFDGAETHHGKWVVSLSVARRFGPVLNIGTYEEGQGDVENVNWDRGLTQVDTVHVERPPGILLMSVEPPTVRIVDPPDFTLKMTYERIKKALPFVTNVPASFVEFIEGAETDDNDWNVSVAVVRCRAVSGY